MSAEEIANAVNEKLVEVLPDVIVKILPNILTMFPTLMKDIIPHIMPLIVNACKDEINNTTLTRQTSTSANVNVQREVDHFLRTKGKIIDAILERRETAYYRYAKCEHHLDLFGECMESQPMYIPKKFRKDNQHVVVQSELAVIKRQELSDFRSECEITRIRRDEYTAKCIQCDDEVKNILHTSNLSEDAVSKLQERWDNLINGDIDRINTKWKKKISGTRETYKKDEAEVLRREAARNPALPNIDLV